jgi:hypothetical protein
MDGSLCESLRKFCRKVIGHVHLLLKVSVFAHVHLNHCVASVYTTLGETCIHQYCWTEPSFSNALQNRPRPLPFTSSAIRHLTFTLLFGATDKASLNKPRSCELSKVLVYFRPVGVFRFIAVGIDICIGSDQNIKMGSAKSFT